MLRGQPDVGRSTTWACVCEPRYDPQRWSCCCWYAAFSMSCTLAAPCRFEVYVCTAAERQYALEVWRLLDTRNNIIPYDQRAKRVVNVAGGRKKLLLK